MGIYRPKLSKSSEIDVLLRFEGPGVVHERLEGEMRAEVELLLGDFREGRAHVQLQPIRRLRHHLKRCGFVVLGEPRRETVRV